MSSVTTICVQTSQVLKSFVYSYCKMRHPIYSWWEVAVAEVRVSSVELSTALKNLNYLICINNFTF